MPASSEVSCSPARSVQQIPETSAIPYTCMKIGPNVSISLAATDGAIEADPYATRRRLDTS